VIDWRVPGSPHRGANAKYEDGVGVNSGAERDAQVEARVREHLEPGEEFRAAVWVSRADSRAKVGLTRAEMSPFRFQRPVPAARRGAQGAPRSLAVGLDEHIRIVTDPRVLALSDRRLLVLSRRLGSWRDLLRRPADPAPPLRPRWQCPRAELASATEQSGRLRLTFTDGTAVTLLTPASRIQSFLAGMTSESR
jgi:hypothetical protein